MELFSPGSPVKPGMTKQWVGDDNHLIICQTDTACGNHDET
jgi:hypothetical protein